MSCNQKFTIAFVTSCLVDLMKIKAIVKNLFFVLQLSNLVFFYVFLILITFVATKAVFQDISL